MTNKKTSVLIVDDEPAVCDLLFDALSGCDYLCTTALSGNGALSELAKKDFDVVLLDIRLPGMSGIEVLREIWSNSSDTVTIMITAVDDVDTAVEAMKWGASDYIVKPLVLDKLVASIRAALESKTATDKSSTKIDAIARGVEAQLDPFSGYSKVVMQRTVDIARRLGFAQEEIQQWAAAKASFDSKLRKSR